MTKTVTIPFKHCSIGRASRFLSESLDQSVEVEDIKNLIVSGHLRACVDFGTKPMIDCLEINRNMELFATIKAAEFTDASDFDEKMRVKLKNFLETYCKDHFGEYMEGILPWLWSSDKPLSKIMPPLACDKHPYIWEISNEGIDGIFIRSVAIATGVWEIDAREMPSVFEALFSESATDTERFFKAHNVTFKRVPETQYCWSGEIAGFKLEENDIVVLDSDIEKVLTTFSPDIQINTPLKRNLSNTNNINSCTDLTTISPYLTSAATRGRAPSAQMRNLVKALIYITPELGEETINEPFAMHEKLSALFAAKGVPMPQVTKESLGGYIQNATWNIES